MNNFDDLMNNLGVKPIKKDENIKNPSFVKESEKKKNTTEEKKKVEKKEKKKKRKKDFSSSFEEALKLYNPEIEEDELHNKPKNNQKIFHEKFSTIEEEDIMHTIDLHGKTLDDAIVLVKERLVWCYREKFDYILIITGKGNHSDNGPVLKIGIKSLLISMSNLIERIEYAPKILGGEGAYIIKIRL